jgi:hypothetical protein
LYWTVIQQVAVGETPTVIVSYEPASMGEMIEISRTLAAAAVKPTVKARAPDTIVKALRRNPRRDVLSLPAMLNPPVVTENLESSA